MANSNMAEFGQSPSREEVTEHYESYFAFERLVLFAVLHVALTLSCAALAFIGHIHVLALLFWLGGTVVLLGAFALSGDWSHPR